MYGTQFIAYNSSLTNTESRNGHTLTPNGPLLLKMFSNFCNLSIWQAWEKNYTCSLNNLAIRQIRREENIINFCIILKSFKI